MTTVLRQKWVIASAFIVTLGCASLFLYVAPPVYRASALVQVQRQAKTISQNLTDQLNRLTGGEVVATAEMQLVSSRLVLGKVFDELALDVDIQPSYFPLIGEGLARRRAPREQGTVLPPPETLASAPVELPQPEAAYQLASPPLFGLSQFGWGGEKLVVDYMKVPKSLYGVPLKLKVNAQGGFDLFDDAGARILGGIPGSNLVGVSDSGLVSLRIKSLVANPGMSFDLTVNGPAEAIAGFLKKFDVAQQGIDSGVIQVSLRGKDPVRVADVVNRIVKSYASQNVEWRSAEASQTLVFLNQQLPDFKAKMEAAQSSLSNFKVKSRSADLPAETMITLQQIDAAEKGLAQLIEARTKQLELFRSNHPSVVTLNEQIQQTQATKDNLKSKIGTLPESQKEQVRLQTEVDVSTRLYTSLLDSIQQLEIAKAGTTGDVRIIDLAVNPVAPVFPKPTVILVAAAVVGTIAGVFLAVLLAALRRKIDDPVEIERITQLPRLSEIPFSKIPAKGKKGCHPLVIVSSPNDVAAEGVRSLRTALHLQISGRANQVIVVTGPSPGIGKSFIAANLAASLARTGQPVLLVDADLRRPALSRYFQGPSIGLTDYLSGAAKLEDVIQTRPEVEGLHYIASGPAHADPAELLVPAKLLALVTEAKARFTYIIFDSPPIIQVSDALVIGKHATEMLLVLQEGAHTEREITDTVNRVRRSQIPIVGFALNKVGRVAGAYYARGYARYGKY